MKYPFLDLEIVNRPYMADMEAAIARVCRSGRYIGGAEVESFEQNLAKLTGAAYAVGVSNGLDALRLILKAWIEMGKLQLGDEVIVPANTYVASVLAIVDAGLVPVLAEPSIETLNLDTSRLADYLTPRTRAVMTVHLYGRACWDENLKSFAKANGLLVIEDNAQAIGAIATTEGFGGSAVTGALGDAGAFSFYPTKNLGAMGDAGAVVTNEAELASVVRALANYGSDRRYNNIYKGYNCRLDPIQAAVLNVKIADLKQVNAHRRALARIYDAEISNPLIRKPLLGGDDNVWHQYPVLADSRDEFIQYLADNGVRTDIHYATPPHRQPALCDISHAPLPITEQIASQEVSLPISQCTSLDDARVIASIINRFVK